MNKPNVRAWDCDGYGRYVSLSEQQNEYSGLWTIVLRNDRGRVIAYRSKLRRNDIETAAAELIATLKA